MAFFVLEWFCRGKIIRKLLFVQICFSVGGRMAVLVVRRLALHIHDAVGAAYGTPSTTLFCHSFSFHEMFCAKP